MKNKKEIAIETPKDRTRQLSIEQLKAIELLVRGQSVNTVAESVGVSSQTIHDWRHDPLFLAELNRLRAGLWSEAQERLRSLANEAIDVLENQLASDDPKVALTAARYVMQGTKLLGDTNLPIGPTTPGGVLMGRLQVEAREELKAQAGPGDLMFDLEEMSANLENLGKHLTEN